MRAYLDPVDRCERVNGLQLHHEVTSHKQVEAAFAYGVALVPDRKGNLPSIRQIAEAEFDAQRALVYRLEEFGSGRSVAFLT